MPINTYLNQTVSIKTRSGYTVEGKPNLGTASNIQARFQKTAKRMVDERGNEYVTDAEIWFKPSQPLQLEDVIVYGGVNYKVVTIETKRDLDGQTHHKKALVVKTKE